jgi:hypothetical protein
MSEVVWSVNIMLGVGLVGVLWVIYKIILIANQENISIQSKKDQESH